MDKVGDASGREWTSSVTWRSHGHSYGPGGVETGDVNKGKIPDKKGF